MRSVIKWIPDWLVAILVVAVMVTVFLLMAWFFRGAMVGASDGQEMTGNIVSVAGWQSGIPFSTEPYTVQLVGGTPTVLPLI
jgi:hypothetical protein